MAYNGCFDDRGTRALRKSWWLSWEKCWFHGMNTTNKMVIWWWVTLW
jgi:hypothetical protein